MNSIAPNALQMLWHDADAREELLRSVVTARLANLRVAAPDDAIVATYFLALRTRTLKEAADDIAYHATSGIKHPPPSSLLEQCTSKLLEIDAFDTTGRLGLVQIAFPVKMMLHPDGHLTSCDILHTIAGAIIFDVYENQDARLVCLQIPDAVVRQFPGPAHGPAGLRRSTGFAPSEPAFGTILKPTAGITPSDVGSLVEAAAACPLFLFIKEDENLYPDLDYSPVGERTRQALAGIQRAQSKQGDRKILFAPHVTGAPHEVLHSASSALDAGANALMLSESFAGGIVRQLREFTRGRESVPAIYGHNAGIGVKTRSIWREVIDLLARLDGIDFRQTAPVKPGPPFLKPYGQEWEAAEAVLTRPLPEIKPVMIVRAGGLDQGNIGLNLEDADRRGITENVMFLAGSAINSITNSRGRPDPQLGAEAMKQALEVYLSGELRGASMEEHLPALRALAERQSSSLHALREALRQRYSH